MKTWIDVEKAFVDAGIKYQQKDWVFLVEIDSRKFYYSPCSGKWRIKRTRAWQGSKSVEDFLALARECLRSGKESSESQRARRRSNRQKRKSKKKTQQTKASNSQRQQNYRSYHQHQDLRDKVRPEFLELFDEKIRICNERNYKPAWIWKVLLDKYLLTVAEICWLCVVFDYSPGWAYHQGKEQYPELTYREIRSSFTQNQSEWLKYFHSRWQFSTSTESRQEAGRQQQNYQRQKGDRHNSDSSSTQGNSGSQRYQSYLDILRINYPFSRQELKRAYRKIALETHPDTGGTTEAFRKVHTAFEVLSATLG